MRLPFHPIIPLILIASLSNVSRASAATLHVPADHPTIQSCIDAAVSGQDECLVAPGTYHELINFLGKAITLRSSHGPEVTTIDGTGLNGSVVTCDSGETTASELDGFTITGGMGTEINGYRYGGGMYNHTGSNPTVTNCTLSGNTAHWGGGMYNYESGTRVFNCTFSRNSGNSAGMYNSSSNVTVNDCTFTENTGEYGGAMGNSDSNPTVTNCSFRCNSAGVDGGGMYNSSSNPIISNCIFEGNSSLEAGGGMYNGFSSPKIDSCIFNQNTASNYGAGMYNWRSSPTMHNCTFSENDVGIGLGGGMYNYETSRPVVIGCAFQRNKAQFGAGMANDFCTPTVADSIFIGNRATYSGAGMYNSLSDSTVSDCIFNGNMANSFGGGMTNFHTVSSPTGNSPKVINCRFFGNSAGVDGGGMYNGQSNPAVINSSFYANMSTDDGAGMYNVISSPTISGCTFSGNMAIGDGAAIFDWGGSPTASNCILRGDSPDEIADTDGYAVITIRFSNVQGGLPMHAIDSGGNIDFDPVFVRAPDPGPDGTWDSVDDDYGDLRLQPGSPCINAGDPDFVPQPGETDLDGHARVLCGRVDMGAYEFGIGDYDCNQSVNLADLSAWPDCMTDPAPLFNGQFDSRVPVPESRPFPPGCEAFDFNANGHIDLLDFAAWQNTFGN